MLQEEQQKTRVISGAWLRFIEFVETEFPHSDIKIRIAAGSPTELLECKRKVRFDKPNMTPKQMREGTTF